MSEIKSLDGRVIKIKMASFDDTCDMKDIIESTLAETGLDLDSLGSDKESLADMDIDFILKPILKITSNKEFRKILFKCLERSSIDGEKITRDTFELVENRGEYYPIVLECLKVNILPFFAPLLSRFIGLKGLLKGVGNQEQK
tara:strand:- start:620 stop:1048 length:429 start_codon:yes stop_codon:yes gene_type:complete